MSENTARLTDQETEEGRRLIARDLEEKGYLLRQEGKHGLGELYSKHAAMLWPDVRAIVLKERETKSREFERAIQEQALEMEASNRAQEKVRENQLKQRRERDEGRGLGDD